MDNATISTDAARRIAGVSYRQLDYWCRQHIVAPSVPADGCGTQRRFSIDQVRAICLAGRLAEMGAPTDVRKRVVWAIEDWAADQWQGWWMVDEVGALHGLAELEEGDMGWLVDLAAIRNRVDDAMSVAA